MSATGGGGREPVVEMTGITVTFPGVRALDAVDFTLAKGEVHALMGENGAGKSTLIKALTGINALAGGAISLLGRPCAPTGPEDAQRRGIATVYQEVNLCPNMTVAENVMLGHEVHIGPFIDWRATRRIAAENLARMHLDIDPRSQLSSHSVAVQQLCAIARALVTDAKVLILDEPTSSLDPSEVDQLFTIVRELRDQGVSIIFVSHFLDQVYEITDRMTVLRNGRLVAEFVTDEVSRRDLVSAMVGHTVDSLTQIESTARSLADDEEVRPTFLQARALGRNHSVAPFDLSVHKGQIIGLAGLLGSGRTEAARLLCGADQVDTGHIEIRGHEVALKNPLVALKEGIAYSTEDRKKDGIIADLTVRENIALALQSARGTLCPIPRKELDEIVRRFMEAMNIRPRDPEALIKNLSGGNQQKVLLARWLATDPSLLLLDEPTRGIDVGAKAEIQKLVTQLASEGMSVMYISSELDEVVRLCHKVCVMRDRRMIATIDNGPEVTQETVLEAIASARGAQDEDGAAGEGVAHE
ncbi:sugar ABC transporter ATP-binding protein [Schaalia sp. 19OD2882]|uniref:sugar ABC transporter ATP-binding protein n=1 Tax=Schaalia sp. 19OD2882 TaxID=2794089 RepID=UPI001C1F1535|nr:sugar ABC transporter ATP-binding protein [Schaalia sp. 19OD2882]QWW20171.1 sugar ABC transporter ATP-binding protein [Schaalia sp. 19OD2882]